MTRKVILFLGAILSLGLVLSISIYLLLPRFLAPLLEEKLQKIGCQKQTIEVKKISSGEAQFTKVFCLLPEVGIFEFRDIEATYSLRKLFAGQLGSISIREANLVFYDKQGSSNPEESFLKKVPASFFYFLPLTELSIESVVIKTQIHKESVELYSTLQLHFGPTSIQGKLKASSKGFGSLLDLDTDFELKREEIHLQTRSLLFRHGLFQIQQAPSGKITVSRSKDSLRMESAKEFLVSVQDKEHRREFQTKNLKVDLGEKLTANFKGDFASILGASFSALPLKVTLDYKKSRAQIVSLPIQVDLPTFLPNLKDLLQIKKIPIIVTQGTASIEGNITIEFGRKFAFHGLSLKGKVEKVSGEAQGISFEALSYPVEVQMENDVYRVEPAELSIAKINSGLVMENFKANLSIHKDHHNPDFAVEIQQAVANVFSGKISSDKISIVPNHLDTVIQLNLLGLDLKKIIELQKQENISGTGTLDGTLPIEISKGEVVIKGGFIKARAPGGEISYNADESLSSVASTNTGFKMAIEALRNFRYQLLEGQVDYSGVGDMALALRLEGKNPGWNNGRPVHFNLNISQNLLDLLRSLRMAEHMSGALEEKVRKKVK